jgi:hypothetical protein
LSLARQLHNSKSQKLRKLWSSCNALFSRVNYAQYYDSINNYASINKSNLIQDFKDDPFASQLITTLPERVTSFEDLKQRFFEQLEPTCRKTMNLKLGDSLSLWSYALGSFESLLIARCGNYIIILILNNC